ncbi:MAG: hypothetical protein AB8B53_03680 [Flavobacteriales bacterium]
MEAQHKVRKVFLRESEITPRIIVKETMTLNEAISFFEKGRETMESESSDFITQELFMKPLLRMADRIV